ncbi:MAG: potassium-transporting ATPase subunit KdpC [Candidatus Sulfotelmatobacter sp.]
MKRNLLTAFLMTIVTTILLGIIYPLVVTGLAQLLFPRQANGELIEVNGKVVGSALLAQSFTSAGYFHPRPSAVNYDASNSNGSQLGPTNRALVDRVNADLVTLQAENPGTPVPIDMVTTSASGLDPDITLAAADFQIPRVAKARKMSEDAVAQAVRQHTESREFGFLGEPCVNVLELDLALDKLPYKQASR